MVRRIHVRIEKKPERRSARLRVEQGDRGHHREAARTAAGTRVRWRRHERRGDAHAGSTTSTTMVREGSRHAAGRPACNVPEGFPVSPTGRHVARNDNLVLISASRITGEARHRRARRSGPPSPQALRPVRRSFSGGGGGSGAYGPRERRRGGPRGQNPRIEFVSWLIIDSPPYGTVRRASLQR